MEILKQRNEWEVWEAATDKVVALIALYIKQYNRHDVNQILLLMHDDIRYAIINHGEVRLLLSGIFELKRYYKCKLKRSSMGKLLCTKVVHQHDQVVVSVTKSIYSVRKGLITLWRTKQLEAVNGKLIFKFRNLKIIELVGVF